MVNYNFCIRERLYELDFSPIWADFHQVDYKVERELSIKDESADEDLICLNEGLFSEITIHAFLHD